ncbi:hypothetical protein TNCV_1662781 [Trichonephila clavipes]|nr:hypothetical protein TNCV_1662781 [Trichonephila clavipes]
MSKRSRLPDSLRWMEMGLTQADAAKRLNVSRSVVHRLFGDVISHTSSIQVASFVLINHESWEYCVIELTRTTAFCRKNVESASSFL